MHARLTPPFTVHKFLHSKKTASFASPPPVVTKAGILIISLAALVAFPAFDLFGSEEPGSSFAGGDAEGNEDRSPGKLAGTALEGPQRYAEDTFEARAKDFEDLWHCQSHAITAEVTHSNLA